MTLLRRGSASVPVAPLPPVPIGLDVARTFDATAEPGDVYSPSALDRRYFADRPELAHLRGRSLVVVRNDALAQQVPR